MTNAKLQSDGKRGAACGISALVDSVKQSLWSVLWDHVPCCYRWIKDERRSLGAHGPPSQSHVSCAPALLCRMAASPVHLPFSATWPVLGRNSPVCVVSALPTLYGCLTRSETPGWVIKPLSQAYWKYTVLSKSLPNKGFKRLLDSPPRSGVRSV